MRVIVTGGSGFIGTEICRIAVALGHEVVSIDRNGGPDIYEPWCDAVEWTVGDVLTPANWRSRLQRGEALIHAVGVVEENPAEAITFSRHNTETALLAAKEAVQAGVRKFVLLSALSKPPFAPQSYLDSFRQAESAVQSTGLSYAILRTSLVYGPRRPKSVVQASMMSATARIPGIGQKMGGVRPLPVETVARAAVRAAEQPSEGVLELDAIEKLASA